MKFVHAADVHLKATPHLDMGWSIDRSSEIWEAFVNLIKYTEKCGADLLLIAGDLFHRQPLLRELKEVNYLFSTLTKAKVVFVVGNHDYVKHDSYYNNFKWNDNVYCLMNEECSSIYIEEINTEIYGLSYYSKEIRKPLYNDISVSDKNRINILLVHGGDDTHIPISKENLRKLEFDYIAMGHIHKPQTVIENFAVYAGSLEPLDYTETGAHGFVSGEIDNKKNVSLRFEKSAKREYIDLRVESNKNITEGQLLNIISEKIRENPNNMYRILIEGFRDEDIVYNVEKIYKLGLVTSVEDNSRPEYDFNKLSQVYKGTVVERFIMQCLKENMTEIEEKALYYGVKALIDGVN